jgi:nucleoside-diphosphate-sugar epimerase
MTDLSLFGGTGYIGSTYEKLFPGNVIIPRSERTFDTKNVLYLISTTTNQNIFKDLQIDIDTNLKILTEVLSHCKRTDTVFNYVSTGFVYGNDILDAKETDCCNPTGYYSVTKRCAEQLLISYCETFGMKYRIFRVGNVFGIDPTVSQGKNVLGYMIRCLKKNDPIKLFDGGNFLKDYIHVDDVCRAMNLLMEKSETNKIYNIGTGESRSFREVIEYAKQRVGSESELIDVEMPEDQKYLQIKNFTMNVDELYSYGFVPQLDIDRGLDMMCEVY